MTEKLKKIFSKYKGSDEVKGDTYKDLISKVIEHNSEHIFNAIGRIEKRKWDSAFKSARVDRQFIIPDVSEVLPKKSVFIKKSAEQGKTITETLYDRLTGNLRDTLEQGMGISRVGRGAGKINPAVIDAYRNTISEVFETYTKKDPKLGVPSNIRNIAITEVRSAVNEVKNTYVKGLIEKNPEVKIEKGWIHNRNLSYRPRKGHAELNMVFIPFNSNFKVNTYTTKQKNGKIIYKLARTESMSHPHDPNGSAENVIGCSCDIVYRVVSKRSKE